MLAYFSAAATTQPQLCARLSAVWRLPFTRSGALIVLTVAARAAVAVLSSVLVHGSERLGLNVNTRLVGKLGSWYSIDGLHRSQKCLPPTNLIRASLRRSKIRTANPPTWINRSRADAHSCKNAAPPSQGDDRQRHGHARPELPPRGRGLARLAEQRALAAVQAGGAERAERLFARALAASPIPSIRTFTLARRTSTPARCRASPRRPES